MTRKPDPIPTLSTRPATNPGRSSSTATIHTREIEVAARRIADALLPILLELATRVVQDALEHHTIRERGTIERLTPREVTVLTLVAQGKTNRAIACELGVSVGTVKIHLEHIIAKLNVSGRTEAATYGVQHRLIDPHTPPH